MDLKTYIADMAVRRDLAAACGTTPDYLWQIATGWRRRRASVDLVKRIEAATDSAVTRHDLRPDIFGPAVDADRAA
jgi:DNA-binding transcriptional regulator YdaS (Cro superfamily)